MASRTTNSGEAMAEQPAAQVALKLGANKGGQLAAGIALLRFDEEGGQIFADDAMEQSLFGLAMLVADPRTDRRAEPRGLFCGARAHQPPPSTAGAHVLRHTFTSHYLMKGGSLIALQTMLGHSSLKTTAIYSHLSSDHLRSEIHRLKF